MAPPTIHGAKSLRPRGLVDKCNMRLFNIDLHISVIEDISRILTDLGHTVVSWNMSNHTWLFGRPSRSTDVVTQHNWWALDEDMCDRFHSRYGVELDEFDAFLTTHAPCLSWLFEKWNKPIIVVASVRYEVPFSAKPALWERFTHYLSDGIDRGKIVPIANNKYDAAYCRYFTERTWTHIPNLCEYTGASYTPRRGAFIYYSRLPQYSQYLKGRSIPTLLPKDVALQAGHKWSEVTTFSGVVGVPYNVSTMSLFEFYTQNMPLFFPSLPLMRQLRMDHPGHVLAESTWNQTMGLPGRSLFRSMDDDPNDYTNIDTFMKWLPLADFYDCDWMPDIEFFDSWLELESRLGTITRNELLEKSWAMRKTNSVRRERVYELWRQVMQRTQEAI